MDTLKVGKQLFHIILGSRAKSSGNEDFDVSILDPKNYSVLNLHTQCPSVYPSSWPIPIVPPQLIHKPLLLMVCCWIILCTYEIIYWIIYMYPCRYKHINEREKSVKKYISQISPFDFFTIRAVFKPGGSSICLLVVTFSMFIFRVAWIERLIEFIISISLYLLL